MRWAICFLFALSFAPSALAADLNILRGAEPVGPPSYTNWSGFYFGGDWGYSDSSADFSQSTQPPLAYALRNSTLENTSQPSSYPTLGTADSAGQSYGGFVGYNSQWDSLILGAELNFVHTMTSLNAPSSPITRTGVSDGSGNTYTITVAGTGTMANLNYVALRGRAGLILGNFLPYAYVGAVVGVADININTGMAGTCDTGSSASCQPFLFTATAGRNSALLYGGTVGGGLDYAVTQNVFLRGEFEYTRFVPFANVAIAVSSARVGAGLKF